MEKTRVRDIMSSPVISIPPETKLPAAIAMMKQHHIRHLPVVDNNRLVGLVSQGDLREASTTAGAANTNSYEISFMLSRLEVRQIMTRKVHTVTPEAYIVYAAEVMTEHKIACLPVVEQDGSVIGMITDSDLLRLLVRKFKEAEEQDQPESVQ